jgi:SAM-dependent methyltransferase
LFLEREFESSVSLKDVALVRNLARLLFAVGDSVRPIVQKPLILEIAGDAPLGRVLDAGCGTGLYTREWLPRATQVDAFDFQQSCIDRLTRRLAGEQNLTLKQGSATEIPFPDATYDLVTHIEVLEHIEDDKKVVSELWRVLKPGGRLILSVPQPPAPFDDKEHVREGYTTEEILGLLKAQGFTIKQKRHCMFAVSKRVMLQCISWSKVFGKIPPPSLILLPLFWERAVSRDWGEDKQPYDIIIEAVKPA